MKRIVLTMGIVLLVILQYSSVTAKTSNDLMSLYTYTKQTTPNMQVNQWSLLIRETFGQSETEMMNSLARKYKSIKWNRNHNSSYATINDSTNNIIVKWIIIPLQETTSKKEIMVIQRITGTDESSLLNKNFKNGGISDLFTKNASFFACLSGSIDGKMDKDFAHQVKDILDHFQADIVEKTTEENFISVSAKSAHFENCLDNGMNLQFSLRNSPNDDCTYLTIGTPILMGEY